MKRVIIILLIMVLQISLLSAFNFESENFGFNGDNVQNIFNSFLSLLDTPSSYTGEGGNCVKVNAGETGLEFGVCGAGGGGGDFSFSDFQGSFDANISVHEADWESIYNATYQDNLHENSSILYGKTDTTGTIKPIALTESGNQKWTVTEVTQETGVDTSASVNCSGSEVFLGNGSCMDTVEFYNYISNGGDFYFDNYTLSFEQNLSNAGIILANGSNPLTGDWDVGGFRLTNIGELIFSGLIQVMNVTPIEDGLYSLGNITNRFLNAYVYNVHASNISTDYLNSTEILSEDISSTRLNSTNITSVSLQSSTVNSTNINTTDITVAGYKISDEGGDLVIQLT